MSNHEPATQMSFRHQPDFQARATAVDNAPPPLRGPVQAPGRTPPENGHVPHQAAQNSEQQYQPAEWRQRQLHADNSRGYMDGEYQRRDQPRWPDFKIQWFHVTRR